MYSEVTMLVDPIQNTSYTIDTRIQSQLFLVFTYYYRNNSPPHFLGKYFHKRAPDIYYNSFKICCQQP